MDSITTFKVLYDRDSDVLYINTGHEPAIRGVEDRNGIVWRYDGGGHLIGATVIDFHDAWIDRRSVLATELSRRFQVSEPQAVIVLDEAMQPH